MTDRLIPAIAQDSKTGEVLMLAYMNDEALAKTIAKENEAAFAAGVQGTPSFFINGQLQDAHSWADLKPALEAATK